VSKKYRVELTKAERETLRDLLSRGAATARSQTYARILLKADESEGGPAWTNAALMEAFEVSEPVICRVRRRFHEGRVPAALGRRPSQRTYETKLDGAQEAHLIALVCGAPPTGRQRWSLRLLAQRFVELGHVEELSHETARKVLKGGTSSPGRGGSGASRRKPTGNS